VPEPGQTQTSHPVISVEENPDDVGQRGTIEGRVTKVCASSKLVPRNLFFLFKRKRNVDEKERKGGLFFVWATGLR